MTDLGPASGSVPPTPLLAHLLQQSDLPTARGTGVGRQLMGKALDYALDLKLGEVFSHHDRRGLVPPICI